MIKTIPGNVIAPKGFKVGSVHCGLKGNKRNHDIGIIFSEQPCKTAALFTKNQIVAAPIKLSRNVVKNGTAQAIVVNSGNANACTGKKGEEDAETMALLTSKHLNIRPDEVIVASTGIIGHHLPMAKIKSGITKSSERLGNNNTHAINIAKAIMTTDLVPKHIAIKTKIGGKEVTIGAIAKGSGMISPDMATMFCFITTDAAISLNTLRTCIKRSTESSFNQITVDGHMSTSDMVAILANGMARNRNITSSTKSDLALFQEALDYVTLTMAKEIVKDGEGATKQVAVTVSGAKKRTERIMKEGIAEVAGRVRIDKFYSLSALVYVEVLPEHLPRLIAKLQKSPVVFCMVRTYSTFSLMVGIVAARFHHVKEFVNEYISGEQGVEKFEVYVGDLPSVPSTK